MRQSCLVLTADVDDVQHAWLPASFVHDCVHMILVASIVQPVKMVTGMAQRVRVVSGMGQRVRVVMGIV